MAFIVCFHDDVKTIEHCIFTVRRDRPDGKTLYVSASSPGFLRGQAAISSMVRKEGLGQTPQQKASDFAFLFKISKREDGFFALHLTNPLQWKKDKLYLLQEVKVPEDKLKAIYIDYCEVPVRDVLRELRHFTAIKVVQCRYSSTESVDILGAIADFCPMASVVDIVSNLKLSFYDARRFFIERLTIFTWFDCSCVLDKDTRGLWKDWLENDEKMRKVTFGSTLSTFFDNDDPYFQDQVEELVRYFQK